MVPRHFGSGSESSDDEGTPETISLAQSKKEIQKLNAELKKAETAERQSKRRQNREVDRKLKERADINRRRSGKKKVDEAGELEIRMRRAMQEAQEEMNEEDESGSEGEALDLENSDEDEDDGNSLYDDQGSVHSDEEQEEEEREAEILPLKPKKKPYNPDHLPDELFTAAFASQSSTSKRKTPEDEALKQTPKKRKRSHIQKDLIVGYASSTWYWNRRINNLFSFDLHFKFL